jgi:hypothetical protein
LHPGGPVTPQDMQQNTSMVSPQNPNEARAALVNAGMPASQAAQIPDQSVQAASMVSPSGSAPAADVTPADSTLYPSVGSYVPGMGAKTGPGTGTYTSSQIRDELTKDKSYEAWNTQKGFANSFDSAAKQIQAIPPAQQVSGAAKMNVLDQQLAESIIKMYDPGAAIREFKWDKLTSDQPLAEQLNNWRAQGLKTGVLTPDARQRLINMGYETVAGKEQAARAPIQLAVQKAKNSGAPIDEVLTPDDMRVAQGQPFNTGGAIPQQNAPTQGKVVSIPNLGNYTLGADGLYHRTQ